MRIKACFLLTLLASPLVNAQTTTNRGATVSNVVSPMSSGAFDDINATGKIIAGEGIGLSFPAPQNLVATPLNSGGTLTAGTRCYVVTRMSVQGGYPGPPSNEACATTTGTSGRVLLSWDSETYITSYAPGQGFLVFRGSTGNEAEYTADWATLANNETTQVTDGGSVSWNPGTFADDAYAIAAGVQWFVPPGTGSLIGSAEIGMVNTWRTHQLETYQGQQIGTSSSDDLQIFVANGDPLWRFSQDGSFQIDSAILKLGTALITSGSAAPSGACAGRVLYVRTGSIAATTLYICNSDVWTPK